MHDHILCLWASWADVGLTEGAVGAVAFLASTAGAPSHPYLSMFVLVLSNSRCCKQGLQCSGHVCTQYRKCRRARLIIVPFFMFSM